MHQAWDKAAVSPHLEDMGGQSLSTRSPMGRMFLKLMAACAELERNLTAVHTASVLALKKQQCKVYNYTRDFSRSISTPGMRAMAGSSRDSRQPTTS